VNEYFSAGLPVVMPHVGAAAAYVHAHGAGVTCPAEPTTFAHAMCATLQNDVARQHMARAARLLADGDLAWDRIGERLSGFYTTGAVVQRVAMGA
jgi:glycosyltransferase involved in cell wall biosynthesis